MRGGCFSRHSGVGRNPFCLAKSPGGRPGTGFVSRHSGVRQNPGTPVAFYFIQVPGGRPGAGYLLLCGQKKKLTEEKAALVSLRLRVPCVGVETKTKTRSCFYAARDRTQSQITTLHHLGDP